MSLAPFTFPPERPSLLELDPALADLLEPERRHAAARALRVDVRHLGRGALDLRRIEAASPQHLGLLIVDGIVTREVSLGDTVSAELLGTGDLIRPWTLSDGGELLETDVRWSVVSDGLQAALLDRRFAAELASYPAVAVALVDRLNSRASRLAVSQAISQLQRVDGRLMALFTHLAERWGRMTSDGVLLPLRLSHRMLGQLVGARRPTVSSAVSQLTRDGALARRPDGSWLLRGELARRSTRPVRHVEPRRAVTIAPPSAEDFGPWRASRAAAG
jgi:CRP/FNR family cyclic AMP-dependent transcriptional regulator